LSGVRQKAASKLFSDGPEAMNTPELTIAVLSYNRAEFVVQMVASILAQTSRNFELDVWDNASTDNTVALLKAIPDPRLSVHVQPQNVGVFQNMNAALDGCRTKYLLLTHDDDRMKPDLVETYLRTLQEEPDLTLLCCNADQIDEAGRVIQERYMTQRYPQLGRRRSRQGGFARDYVEGFNYLICPTALLNVEVLREHGLRFRSDAGPAGDSLFWCQLSFLPGSFVFLDQALFEYRIHQKQDTARQASVLATKLRRPLFEFLQTKDAALARLWWKNSQPMVMTEWFDRIGTPTDSVVGLFLTRLSRLWKDKEFSLAEKVKVLSIAKGKALHDSAVALRRGVKKLYYGGIREGFNLLGRLIPRPRSIDPQVVLITGALGYGGGPFTFFRFLVERLSRTHRVVLSFREGDIRDELRDFCAKNEVQLVSRPNGSDAQDLLAVGRVIGQVKPGLTIVNAGSFAQCFSLLALRSPVLYYSHSIWHRPLSPGEALFLDFFRRRKHKIVTVSAAASQSLKDAYFPTGADDRIHWVHNAVSDRLAAQDTTEARPLTVTTLGSVVWYKNPELWLRVARVVLARMPKGSVQFVWAGSGELLEALKKTAEENIRFLGQVADPDTLLARTAVYFQPSRFESFGLGVCEAMMFGKPVVVTAVGALPELVVDGDNGFVVAEEDEPLLAERLIQLLNDEALRTSLGASSRRRYQTQFTPEHWDAGFASRLK